LGLKEQLIFPEIKYDAVQTVHGMDITIVTTAADDAAAKDLLARLGMPFREGR
jgi:large subunit ribosomal protein L5